MVIQPPSAAKLEPTRLFAAETTFQVKQSLFPVDSAAVTRQCTVFSHNAVTGNKDGQWIPSVRLSYRPGCRSIPHLDCLLLVTPSFTIGDLRQGVPGPQLKGRSVELVRQVKLGTESVEIFSHLDYCDSQQGSS